MSQCNRCGTPSLNRLCSQCDLELARKDVYCNDCGAETTGVPICRDCIPTEKPERCRHCGTTNLRVTQSDSGHELTCTSCGDTERIQLLDRLEPVLADGGQP